MSALNTSSREFGIISRAVSAGLLGPRDGEAHRQVLQASTDDPRFAELYLRTLPKEIQYAINAKFPKATGEPGQPPSSLHLQRLLLLAAILLNELVLAMRQLEQYLAEAATEVSEQGKRHALLAVRANATRVSDVIQRLDDQTPGLWNAARAWLDVRLAEQERVEPVHAKGGGPHSSMPTFHS